jgi:hypothetical protein
MASAPMQRPVLALADGVPVEIALKYATGKQVANGRIMFSTVDGEVFFLDEFDADQIYALELKPQEPFKIMKRNKQIIVERKRVEQPVGPAPTAPATVSTPVQQNQQSQSQSNNSLSGLMASSYISAIDALTVARDYAEHKGIPFRLSMGEIRSAAHCIFIAASRGVR